MDKRILPSERCADGECAVCGRRHIHRDDCATLQRRMSKNDKRVLPDERNVSDECAVCGEPFVHRDDCATLQRRIKDCRPNDGTDPDQPPPPYAGGLLS
jgi:predicted RNA-binding Zn-ribbon protein involved in translation (DUF1610 family)